MLDKLSENLNILMVERRLSADELARRIGVPASTIKKIRNRQRHNPTLATLMPIADYFALTLDQLTGTKPLAYKQHEDMLRTPVKYLPLYSWQDMSHWPERLPHHLKHAITDSNYSKRAFAVELGEDLQHFTNGSLLFIEPEIKYQHKDFVLVFKPSCKRPCVKQIIIEGEITFLKSLVVADHYEPLENNIDILGVIIEYKNRLRY